MNTTSLNVMPLRPYLKTTYDVSELLDILQRLQGDIFQKRTTLEKSLQTDIPVPLSTIIMKMANEQKVTLQDPTATDRFLTELQDAIKAIPALHLTVSISPTLQLINQISDWLLLQVPEHVILDFTTDRSLIGGAKVGFNGKYVDYSLKKQVAGLLTTNLEKSA